MTFVSGELYPSLTDDDHGKFTYLLAWSSRKNCMWSAEDRFMWRQKDPRLLFSEMPFAHHFEH